MGNLFDSSVLQEYLTRWQAGDRSAGDDLVRSVMARLQKLGRRMLRGYPYVRSLVDIDDVLQNSLMRLLHTLRRLKPATTRDFFNLAAVHVRRELIDIGRRTKREFPTVSLEKAYAELPSLESDSANAAPEALDQWVHFHTAVDQLPVEHREVVGLVFYHGWTQTQIATLFDVDVRTVRRRWVAACEQLRRLVGSDFFQK